MHAKLCVYDFQTCVRSTVTSPTMMSVVGLLYQESTAWTPAAAPLALPGAPNVTNVQKGELQNLSSYVLGAQGSHTGVTSSMADPSSKVLCGS